MASQERPTGLKATKGIELLTFGTPNGVKASILLEELKDAYGLQYSYQGINIMQNIQKEDWFTKLGPNGRIPVIVDHDKGGFSVMEGIAILNYLTRHYDPEHKFSFADPLEAATAEQWIGWQHGNLGLNQGQANHFVRFTKDKIPYAIQRFVGECERLYSVLNTRLDGRDFVAGPGKGTYSIADIALIGWVNGAYFSGIDLSQFPNVEAWWERVVSRPAVQRGLEIPTGPSPFGNKTYLQRIKEDKDFGEQEKGLKELVQKAKDQYGYKFAKV